jgi:hypothetical protein
MADPDRLAPLRKWPKPKNIREMRGFLGFAGNYCGYVQNFARICSPLYDLTKKGVWGWKEEHDVAFEVIKEALLANVPLAIYDPGKPFWMRCDASIGAVGAVLEQRDASENLRPVAFFSRKLLEGQSKWSTPEQEMYAVVSSLAKWEALIGSQLIRSQGLGGVVQWAGGNELWSQWTKNSLASAAESVQLAGGVHQGVGEHRG